jgi:hypothetical protein
MIEIIQTVLAAMWHTTTAMGPYLLFGFFMAGVLSVLISPATVERHLGRRKFLSVLKASAFGVPLPLCSCGVIPVGTSLRRHGASKGAATSFLISTPQTGVDSILITLSLLGPLFAVARPIIAFAAGLLGGTLVNLVEGRAGDGPDTPMAECMESCCSGDEKRSVWGRMLHYGFVALPRDLAKPLIVGIVIAGIIHAIPLKDILPEGFRTGLGGMLFLLAFSVPLYVCATASVPMAAALWLNGFSTGPVLVLLMAGPATNAATIAAIMKVMNARIAAIYVGTIASVAVGAGLLLDHVAPTADGVTRLPAGWEPPAWLSVGAALFLIGLLLNSLRPEKPPKTPGKGHPGEETLVLDVTGMTCSHCALAVEDALRACAGVHEVRVSLSEDQAEIEGHGLDRPALIAAVEEAGFGTRGPAAERTG